MNLTTVSTEQLDDILRTFYAQIRMQNGQHYSKASLATMRQALKRFFLEGREINILDPNLFPVFKPIYDPSR